LYGTVRSRQDRARHCAARSLSGRADYRRAGWITTTWRTVQEERQEWLKTVGALVRRNGRRIRPSSSEAEAENRGRTGTAGRALVLRASIGGPGQFARAI